MSARRRRLAVAVVAALAPALALVQGCTDGTTPDCSDAQCAVVSVVEAGVDGAGDSGPTLADAEQEAPEMIDAGANAEGGAMSDVGADAPPRASDAAAGDADAG
jgi:hypothetical protein